MVNGVVQIVAAVLFAVVFLSTDMGMIWLWIAGVYLAIGVGNLVIYVLRSKHQLRAARKQAEKSAKEAEKSAIFAKQVSKLPEQKAEVPEIIEAEECV